MTIHRENRDGTSEFRVQGPMTIYEAVEIREALMDGFGESDNLRIDLEGLESIDITGLQLIIAARKTARRQGKGIRLTGVSEMLTKVLAEAGIDSETFFQGDRKD